MMYATNHVAHRALAELDAFALGLLALAIDRQVIHILGHDDVANQAWAERATSNRPTGGWRLCHPAATGAGHTWAHMTNDAIACGNVFKDFADVFANCQPVTAAIRASGLVRHVGLGIARQMAWQLTALGRCTFVCLWECTSRDLGALGDVHLFKLEYELIDLGMKLFRLLAKRHALEFGNQKR